METEADARRFGLTAATIEKITSVFADHPLIDEVIIYGSRAKGTYRHGSDIDLTIKGRPSRSRS